MKKLTSIALSSASALLLSSSAMAWDVWDYEGTAPRELHSTKSVIPANPSPQCNPGTSCQILNPGTEDGQVFAVIKMDNKTPGGADGSGTPVAECYTTTPADYTGSLDLNGNPTWNGSTGDYGKVTRLWQFLHAPAGGPIYDNISQDVIPDIMNICTNAEGKIVSGNYGFFTFVGFNVYSITTYDGDDRFAITFENGTRGNSNENVPTAAEAAQVIADFNAGTLNFADTYGATNDWIVGSLVNFAYETCDILYECGQFNKAVPVPAFAAAALGLGLIGITLVTGRRRAIK
ncbi:MAG: hypothetical protein KJP25_01430 [Gammaproteobacteria bacterium]|nr:hypothetical protein [Gammaproteobacteria bacterium]MBT8152141.1 hypothetical protein [Gammaproteobacteria bacterium]RZV53266.1 MAG: hypothetical protein EX270_08905 [Pseudomonadales bacterium]